MDFEIQVYLMGAQYKCGELKGMNILLACGQDITSNLFHLVILLYLHHSDQSVTSFPLG